MLLIWRLKRHLFWHLKRQFFSLNSSFWHFKHQNLYKKIGNWKRKRLAFKRRRLVLVKSIPGFKLKLFPQVQVIDISQTSAELCGPANRTPRRSKTQTGSDFKTGRICNLIYSDHLSTKRVWYSNGRFVSGCQMVWYVNGGLKTSLRKACLWFNPFKSLQTHLNTDTNTVQYSGVRYLDGYCIW